MRKKISTSATKKGRTHEEIASQGVSTSSPDPVIIYSVSNTEQQDSTHAYISLAGEQNIFIKGTGFQLTPEMNDVYFVGDNGEQFACTVTGATKIFITCLSETVPDGYERHSLNVIVVVNDESGPRTSTCGASSCLVSYRHSITPKLFNIFPRSATPGTIIYWNGIYGVKSTEFIVLEQIKIGEFYCDRFNLGDWALNPNSKELVDCVVAWDAIGGIYTDPNDPIAQGVRAIGKYAGSTLPMSSLLMRTADRTNLYAFRIIPAIDSLNTNIGSPKGQIIEIHGRGFSKQGEDVKVKVAGLNCKTTTVTLSLIVCEVEPAAAPLGIVGTGYIGGSGLMRQNFSLSVYYSPSELKEQIHLPVTSHHSKLPEFIFQDVAFEAEQMTLDFDYYGEVMKGYFKAPATGNHRFFVSGDDLAEIWFCSTPNTTDTSNLQRVAYLTNYTKFRNYNEQDTQISAPIALVKDSYYYLEIYHVQWNGTGHVSVAVESPSDVYYPESSLPTIQTVEIDFNPDYEKIMMKLYLDSKPTTVNGYWSINFCGILGSEISWGASGETVAARINKDVGNLDAYCERLYLDNTGNIIENGDLAVGYQYDCTFYKWRDYWDSTVIKSSNYKYPNIITTNLQALNAAGGLIGMHTQKSHVHDPEANPLKGTFSLSYGGSTSSEINYDDDENDLYYKLAEELGLSSKVQVETYGDAFSGLKWRITMYGEPSPQLLQQASSTLTGGDETHFPKLVIKKVQEGSNNIFHDPISNDLLFQNKTEPQVQISVKDVLGTCPQHNCDYIIDEAQTPNLKTLVLEPASASSKMTITLDAKTFPVEEHLIHITINGITCPLDSYTAGTEITIACIPPKSDDNTKYLIPSGVIKPKVHIKGIGYALDSEISAVTIPLAIESVNPSTLPEVGGSPVTILGSGFPLQVEEGLAVTVSGTECTVLKSSATEITFTSPPKNSGTELKVEYNSQIATDSVTFDNTPGPSISNIFPTTASPVQKTDMVITGNNFQQSTENDTWYQCVLVGRDTQHTTYNLDVLPGSVTNTQMTCILSGGIQGTYDVFVRKIVAEPGSTFLGYLSNSTALAVQYQLDITQISPSLGSKAGGTLITLSGTNLAVQQNQNLVVIGQESYSCAIESATIDTVTCRTTALPENDSGGAMIVHYYQRVQEKGKCTAASCEFSFIDSATPTITDDLSSPIQFGKDQILTFHGNLLQPHPGKKAYLIFNNQQIEATTASSALLQFTMPGIKAGTYAAKILIDNLGYAQHSAELKLEAKFEILSLTPTTAVSEGGALLEITGNGFSANTTVTIDSVGLCQVAEFTTSTLKCRSLPITGSDHEVSIYDINTPSSLKSCNACKISSEAASTATITGNNATSATSDASVIIKFDGTLLDLCASADITCQLVSTAKPYRAYESATIVSQTSISLEIEFSNLPAGEYKAYVNFKGKGYAKFTPETNQIVAIDAGALTVPSITSSFAGGQALTISGNGFSTDSSGISISVCGFDCPITSTAYDEISCQLPQIVTEKSNEEFSQVKPKDLKAVVVTGDNAELAPLANDGLLSTSYESSSENCYIILDYGEQLQAQVQQIIYSPKQTLDLAIFDQSQFLGCNENCDIDSNWQLIHEIEQIYMTYGLNTWKPEDPTTIKSYRYIKFTSPNKVIGDEDLQSGCQLTEFYIHGVLVTPSATDDLLCDVVMNINGKEVIETEKVSYTIGSTPTISQLDPPFGSSLGGEDIEISGTGFGSDTAVVSVLLEGQACSVTEVSDSLIKCTTIARSGNWQDEGFELNALKVVIDGQTAANKGNNWMYVDRWSLKTTWGGESPPMKGQSAYIPAGRNVLIDESLPELYSIIIEGSFICASHPDYIPEELTIDAWFIVCNRGMVQIGTELRRYEKKITITLHGSLSDTQLPLFGNKVLAVFEGLCDMHGKLRTPTWTSLTTTASQGASTIEVEQIGDWQEGDQIVIATNDFDYNHTEVRYIKSVAGSVITLNETLNYTHFSGVETHGSQELPMKCEVALLTRTIKIQGADGSWEDRYGGHTMVTGDQAAGSVGRISYVEFFRCGQQKILGRYPIHFHLGGKRDLSYADGNAVHHSLARVTTIHGIHFLKVTNTVGYYISGHAIFIEDGAETHNLVKDNLVINTRQVWTLIQTDVEASCIWVTHPLNDVIGNRCAGGDWFGVWYELFVTPTGPSVDPTVCPEGLPMGKFENNTAHSFMKYGFRAKQHWPRKYSCRYFIHTEIMDQYSHNPSYEVEYGNFVAWKNHDNGFQFEHPGHVLIKNVTVADNGLAGIIIWSTNHSHSSTFITQQIAYQKPAELWIARSLDCPIQMQNGQFISYFSPNYKLIINQKIIYSEVETRGLVTPNTDGLYVENLNFYNYNENMTALGSCAICWHILRNITGGVTTHFKNLYFDASVKRRIWWEIPRREIYHDIDGKIAGTGYESYISPFMNHLNHPTLCTKTEKAAGQDYDVYNGSVICDGRNHQLRQIVFKGLHPWDEFQAVFMNVVRIDDDSKAIEDYDFDNDWTHLGRAWNYINGNDTKYTFGCAFLTGFKFRVHWGHLFPMDWKTLMIMPSVEEWELGDKNLILQFNHTQPRELYDISEWLVNGSFSKVWNDDNSKLETMYITPKSSIGDFSKRGDYYHDSVGKLLSVNIAGDTDSTIHMTPVTCRYNCPDLLDACEDEDFVRKWSDPNTWTQQEWSIESAPRIPQDGDNITITCGYTVLVDVENTAKLEHIEVNGHLTFDPEQPITRIYAKTLWVRQGTIKAGESESDPFPQKIEFNFYGHSNYDHIVIAEDLEAGNKLFAITNKVELYGCKIPDSVNTRLSKSVKKGDHEIQVVNGGANGWEVGDELGIAPTSFNGSEYEKVKIAAISGDTVTLEQPLSYDHYGAEHYITTNAGNLDMRALVSHLTRNISIDHDDEDSQIGRWGCYVLIGGYTEKDMDQPEIEEYWVFRTPNATLNGVEIRYCGQPSSTRAAISFLHNYDSAENVKLEANKLKFVPQSSLSHSSVHSAVGKCLYMEMARNISVFNNAFFECRKNGMWIFLDNDYFYIENNAVIGVYDRDDIDPTELCETTAGIEIRDPEPHKMLSMKNNVIQGGSRYGYWIPGELCNEERFYTNNSAGSVYTGIVVVSNISQCLWLTDFQLYKNAQGIDCHFEYEKLVFEDIVFAENKMGAHSSSGRKEFPYNVFQYKNIYMTPIARPDCEECYPTASDCSNFIGIIAPGTEGEPNHIPYLYWFNVQWYCNEHNFDCRLFIDDSTFLNWKYSYSSESNVWLQKCGHNRAFEGYDESFDQLADTYLYNTTCSNCEVDGLANFLDEDLSFMGWLGGCGMMVCIGHRNWMVTDIDGKFIGGGSPVQLVPNNPDLFRGTEKMDCVRNDQINGWFCQGNPFTVLHFEAFGKDQLKRLLSPVNISAVHGYNMINAQKEWHWDGPLPMDMRKNRFYAIVKKGEFYNVTYGTVPHPFMRYQLIARKNPYNQLDYMVLQVFYIETNGAPRIYVGQGYNYDGEYRKSYRVDENIDLISKKNDCGANIYYYKNNTIAFLINSQNQCLITINQSSAIQVTTYLATTETGFYNDNVASTFLDRMMAFLGISFSDIRIQNVRNGTSTRRQLSSQEFTVEWEIFTNYDETSVSRDDVQQQLNSYISKLSNANSSQLSTSNLTYLKSNYTFHLKKTTEELKQEDISRAQEEEESETELEIIPVVDSTGNQIIPIAEVSTEDSENNTDVLLILFTLSVIFILIVILLIIYSRKKKTMYKAYLARAKMTAVRPGEQQQEQQEIHQSELISPQKPSVEETESLGSKKEQKLEEFKEQQI